MARLIGPLITALVCAPFIAVYWLVSGAAPEFLIGWAACLVFMEFRTRSFERNVLQRRV